MAPKRIPRKYVLHVTSPKGNDMPLLGFYSRRDALRAAAEFRAKGCHVKIKSYSVEA